MSEYHLMKGNEALAEAAIRAGVDGYFGYPITPQSEILEYLTVQNPYKKTGMVILQAESEVSAINMIYGAAACGKKAFTSSSSPGISLMQEAISYIAAAELPCLVVNVVRGGPGLGSIQPSQADYFQSVKGGGHGDYKLIVLAPASVQEMADFVKLSFDLAFKYRNPALILSDGMIGQMMEKVKFDDYTPRSTKLEPWATTGKTKDRAKNVISTVELDPQIIEDTNTRLFAKYKILEETEVRYEEFQCGDAEYLLVAFGSSARICQKTVQLARAKGIKLGLLRPITLYPFPTKRLNSLADQVKGMLSVEMNMGQMVEDIRLSVNGKVKVEHFGRSGGMIFTPDDALNAMMTKIYQA